MTETPRNHVREGALDLGRAHVEVLHAAHRPHPRRRSTPSAAAPQPMASKMALARRPGRGLPRGRRGRARRGRVAPRPSGAAGSPRRCPCCRSAPPICPCRAHEFLARNGLAPSKSEAMRLLRQRAVKRDGIVVEAGTRARTGAPFVLSSRAQPILPASKSPASGARVEPLGLTSPGCRSYIRGAVAGCVRGCRSRQSYPPRNAGRKRSSKAPLTGSSGFDILVGSPETGWLFEN